MKPRSDSPIDRFKAALQRRTEERQWRELIHVFASAGCVTDEEARIAADAVMEHRRRRRA